MNQSAVLAPEFIQEMATTRRLIERVPGERGEWKPHEKSFALGHLTQLVATMPGWITRTIRETEIDLGAGSGWSYSFQRTDALLEQFDEHVREAREAITAATDPDFDVPWSLRNGDRVYMTMPRGAAVRMHLNHLIHHRGQLSVYLRLIDVPVPSIYGPTADEKW